MGQAHMEIVFVVAMADNGVIGRNGAMPWRLKSELRHFRALTLGHPVVMGRKTYLAIGRPLPGRTNIVVTRDRNISFPGAVVAPSTAAALAVARGDALRRGAGAVMVIGGADIYAQLMARADRIELTRVHAHPAGDAFFAEPEAAVWRLDASTDHLPGVGDEAGFTTQTYRRVERPGGNPYKAVPERQ
jgi:dihydrofolate reductase